MWFLFGQGSSFSLSVLVVRLTSQMQWQQICQGLDPWRIHGEDNRVEFLPTTEIYIQKLAIKRFATLCVFRTYLQLRVMKPLSNSFLQLPQRPYCSQLLRCGKHSIHPDANLKSDWDKLYLKKTSRHHHVFHAKNGYATEK
jgi:hypothetical protein